MQVLEAELQRPALESRAERIRADVSAMAQRVARGVVRGSVPSAAAKNVRQAPARRKRFAAPPRHAVIDSPEPSARAALDLACGLLSHRIPPSEAEGLSLVWAGRAEV
jgi:hypothetical protein